MGEISIPRSRYTTGEISRAFRSVADRYIIEDPLYARLVEPLVEIFIRKIAPDLSRCQSPYDATMYATTCKFYREIEKKRNELGSALTPAQSALSPAEKTKIEEMIRKKQ